jgi:peptidoglycan hydrolase-like protein with peptidoglycan-binding domain
VRVVKLAPIAVAVALWFAPAAIANPQHAGIQVALRAHGLYLGAIDGRVGPLTVAAIRTFQQKARLPVTGLADARTRAALGPLGRPLFGERNLRAGFLGPETQAALRGYQARMRLAADGIAGPRTRAALVLQNDVPVRAKRVMATGRTYVVRPGDSLTAIAQQHGTSVGALARANRIDASQPIVIGTRLRIPARTTAARTSQAALAAAPSAVRDILDKWALELGVSRSLVRALAWMESGFQVKLISSAGAKGVLQTLPVTRDFVEDVLVGHALPPTLDGDVQVGVLYLRHLLRQFNGNESLALAAWYQGEAAVRRDGVYGVTKPFVANVQALKARF